MMVPPVPEGDPVPDDEWVIKVSTDNKGEAISYGITSFFGILFFNGFSKKS